ncbi:MAG TPA: acyl-CoA dehydrogenase family protein [Planctomycetota bacterium]|nr:acyl-CoA dehydrogenase family protein [Planctomycetota bacterium]
MNAPFAVPEEAELEALRAEAAEFAEKELRPGVAQRDRDKTFPRAQVAAAAARGWLGILAPKDLGGSALGNLRQTAVLEELARVDASTHVTISVHNSLVVGPTVKYGSDALKRRYVPRLARGEALGAYALTEPQAGSDAAALACTADRDGDAFVLNGSKMWITTGDSADVILAFARTDRTAPKAKGVSAFLVDRRTPGLTAGKPENKLGIRASETVQLFFENVRVPADNLLGEPNRGFQYALETLNGGRVGIATQATGIAQGILDAVVAYFSGRVREGKPARTSQNEDFRVAEMATKVHAARLLTRRAAALRDAGAEHVREASMAKLFASQACNEIARDAVALLGPAAWAQGSDFERLFRDARITEIYEGTTEVQKLVIARTYLRG